MRNRLFKRSKLSGKGLYEQIRNSNSYSYGRFTIESLAEVLKEMEHARIRKT